MPSALKPKDVQLLWCEVQWALFAAVGLLRLPTCGQLGVSMKVHSRGPLPKTGAGGRSKDLGFVALKKREDYRLSQVAKQNSEA